MDEAEKRRVRTLQFNASGDLVALGGVRTINEIANEYGPDPALGRDVE